MTTNQKKKQKSLDLTGGKPTMIWVLRYIGCTVCHLDMRLLEKNDQLLTEKSIVPLVVLQSKPEMIQRELNDVI